MTRFLLAGAVALLALAPAAQAAPAICGSNNVRACAGELACGEDGSKCGVQRCYYWTDYPTCLY